MLSGKAFKVVSILVTVLGAGLSVASSKIQEKNMKDEIAKQVSEQLANKN